MKTALTIAGSDSSGGAGIQADIKTMTANGVYAMSAICSMTAQNTTGVSMVMDSTCEFLEAQIDSVFTDIYPDAVKTGMLSNADLVRVVASKLKEFDARNIVVDPVMVATSGARLISEEAVGAMKKELLPLALLATPNIPEAEVLSGIRIKDFDDMNRASKIIYESYGCEVLVKGGHLVSDATDVLCDKNGIEIFTSKKIDNPNTHGTGCTLSAAIASNLAKGYDIRSSIRYAKNYLTLAISDMLDLGNGAGPMNHAFAVKGEFID